MYSQAVPSNDSDVVIPSLPSSGSQPTDSPLFLMEGLGTKHRVWFQRFGTSLGVGARSWYDFTNYQGYLQLSWYLPYILA